MDPQASWEQLQEALRIGAREAVRELAQVLFDWLDRWLSGGENVRSVR